MMITLERRRRMEKMKRKKKKKMMRMAWMKKKKKIRGVMTSDSERPWFATRPHKMVLLLFKLLLLLYR